MPLPSQSRGRSTGSLTRHGIIDHMSPRPQLTAGPVLSQRVCATAQGPHGVFSFCVRFLFGLWVPWAGKNFTAASQTSSTLTSLSQIAQAILAEELHNQSVKVRCLCSAYVKWNLPPRGLPPSACLNRCLFTLCSPCAVLETPSLLPSPSPCPVSLPVPTPSYHIPPSLPTALCWPFCRCV